MEIDGRVPNYSSLTAMLKESHHAVTRSYRRLTTGNCGVSCEYGHLKLSQMVNYEHELVKNPLTNSLIAENGTYSPKSQQ